MHHRCLSQSLSLQSMQICIISLGSSVANKLAWNEQNSKYILFSKRARVDNIMITMNGIPIIRQTTKFGGVIVPEQLSWADHIQWWCSRISSSVFAINAVKNFVPQKCLQTLHYCIVYAYQQYWVMLCDSMYDNINQIRVVQRKAVRIIGHCTNTNGTKLLFRDLKLLPLNDDIVTVTSVVRTAWVCGCKHLGVSIQTLKFPIH